MTRNLKTFAVFSVVWSILFFVGLNWGTADSAERWPAILVLAVVYGSGFAVVGRLLGKRDDQSKVRYSLEYAYSATSHLVSAVIGSIWIVWFRSQESWFLAVYLPAVLLVAALGLVSYRKSIKGVKNEQLFR